MGKRGHCDVSGASFFSRSNEKEELIVVIVFSRLVFGRHGWTRILCTLRCLARIHSFSPFFPCFSFLGTMN